MKINGDDLFKNIEEVRENAIFEGTDVTNLGKCKKIKGWAVFNNSNVENLGDLEEVGAATFAGDKPSDFGKLKKADYIDIVYAPNLLKQDVKNIEIKNIRRKNEQFNPYNGPSYQTWYKWEINNDPEFAEQEGFIKM